MIDVIDLRKNILNGKIDINDLNLYENDLRIWMETSLSKKVLSNEAFDVITNLIMLYLDYYTYAEDGDVLITDFQYDMLMNHYINNGGKQISKADKLMNVSQWNFVKHEMPGMVGTLKKIYTFEELQIYFNKYRSGSSRFRRFIIAPKYDGISSAIKIVNGRIVLGVTRNNGFEGQDITQVVRNACNANKIVKMFGSDKKDHVVWLKTELVIRSQEFEKVIEEKTYKNRRSATSGIVNSPKNVHLAKYISIIPLAAYQVNEKKLQYCPPDSKEINISNAYDLKDDIDEMISKIRDSSYDIRTDGVVLYPIGDDILPNFNDIMDDAVAFKVNTSKAFTTVEYGYVSVGRLGNAVPMFHVKPCDVNETTVTDVSLGSFDKFYGMDVHEGEQIEVYSAGDVIPQAKLPEIRHYKEDAPLIKIKKRCPYCNEKLTRYKATYRCENQDCPRIKSGKISNFIIKLKAKNVSDRTIEDLVEAGLVKSIPDLFDLTIDEIAKLDGYGKDSAKIIVDEIEKIRTTETPVSTMMGALGIQGISEKKCKKLFKVMNLKKMLKTDPKELLYDLVSADSTGRITAQTFIDFLQENKKLIKQLVEIMNITTDIEWKGNVVFTGARDHELENRFMEKGYEISSAVNGNTIVVIDASYNHESTKCKAAKKKGIDIIHISEAEDVLKQL